MLLQLSRGPVSENLRSSIIGSDGWLQNIIVLRNSSLAGLFTDRAAGGAPRPRMNFLMLLSLGLEIQILALERRGKRAKDSRSSWLIAESYWFWTAWSRSRTALWELDNLRRSLHLLNYVELTQFQRNIQRADRASVDRKCPRARGIASCLARRTRVAAGRPRRPGASARRDDASDRRGRECRRRARPGNDATGWIDRHLSAQRHQDWRHRGGGTGGDLGARAWRRLRAALFLLRTGLPSVASPRCGVRAGGRLRALLRRPASQPVSRRRARSPGPTVSATRARAGTRSGHGGTQSLPPRPPGRDRKLTVCFHSGRPTALGREFAGDVSYGAIGSLATPILLPLVVWSKALSVGIDNQEGQVLNITNLVLGARANLIHRVKNLVRNRI